MPLTPDQQRAIANHVQSRAQLSQCPVCDAANMVVREELISTYAADEEASGEPLIQVVCRYCGHVLHFSPSALGLSMD